MRRANYVITEDDFLQKEPLVIKDMGPWDEHPSVTNYAEGVVAELVAQGHLNNGRRLYCIDSSGDMDELLVKDGIFDGFAPIPRG